MEVRGSLSYLIEAWPAAVHGVTKSRTRLSDCTTDHLTVSVGLKSRRGLPGSLGILEAAITMVTGAGSQLEAQFGKHLLPCLRGGCQWSVTRGFMAVCCFKANRWGEERREHKAARKTQSSIMQCNLEDDSLSSLAYYRG